MKELAALAYRDTSPESRDFWKNELAQAIREIEQMYAEKLDDMKRDTEANYSNKVLKLHKRPFMQNVHWVLMCKFILFMHSLCTFF